MTEQNDWNFDRGELPHRAQLHRMALRLTRSAESAEDLLQDTYLKAFRHYGTFRPGTNLRAWLFRILKNTFINDYRRQRKAPVVVAFELIEGILESALAPAHGTVTRTPEDEVVDASLDGEVERALAALPHAYKVIVLLSDIEGHSYKEIATLLEIPPGTVMSRLYRGRRLLERALLSFGVRYNYLTRRPRRLRSTGIDLDRIFDLSAAPAAPARISSG